MTIYHDKPAPDIPLEDNKEFRSIKNAIIKADLELDSNTDVAVSNSKVNNMVTLWIRLLGGMINDSYQKKQSHLNNQIDSKLKSKIEQKKRTPRNQKRTHCQRCQSLFSILRSTGY